MALMLDLTAHPAPMQTIDPIEEAQHEVDARYGVVDLFRDMIADLEARWREENAARSHEAEPVSAPDASLGEIIDRLDERAFGLLFILLCLPCIPPFIYVLPQIVSLPMLALAGQMAAGRQSPWFPEKFRERRFALAEFTKVLDLCEKYVRWFERIARPRFPAVTGRTGARVIGGLTVVPVLSILTPLIGTNTVPSIGIAITSLGLIQRDGLLAVLGLVISLGWVTALVLFALFFGVEFATFLKDWIGERF
jgi:hypothetical protein